jgi:hypothetical protein
MGIICRFFQAKHPVVAEQNVASVDPIIIRQGIGKNTVLDYRELTKPVGDLL